jgi:hypothetical protein
MVSRNPETEVLPNLGPVSTKWLREIGVHSRLDVERIGPMEIYVQLKRRYPERVSLNLLYGLEAGLRGVHWTKLPTKTRERLKREASRLLASED